MRTLTGLSGKYVTFDQNVSKLKFEFEVFLMHRTGKIHGFNQLEVLLVHFDKLGRVNLEFRVNFQKFELDVNYT